MTELEAISVQIGHLTTAVSHQTEILDGVSAQLKLLIARTEVNVCTAESAMDAAHDAKVMAMDTKAVAQACSDQLLELTQAIRSRPCMVPARGEPCLSASYAGDRRGLRAVETIQLVDEAE